MSRRLDGGEQRAEALPAPEAGQMSEVRPSIRRLRERKERHKQRSRFYRVSFAAIGIMIIVLGLILVPLPGPGWLIVALGVGMLALEFDRMERLLEKILDRLEATSERLSNPQKLLIGLLAIAGAAAWITAIVLWEVPVLPG
jgi:uncharacterized protein (TIGR02611 family)